MHTLICVISYMCYHMFMRTFTHIHSSSKWDRPEQTLVRASKKYARFADIITWTELDDNSRQAAVKNTLKPEYGHVGGDESYANDCVISFKKARFTLLYKENFQTTTANFYDKGGRKKDPQWSTNAVLRDSRTGLIVVVCVVHLASGIEGDLGAGRKTLAVKNWFGAFYGVRKRARQLKKAHKADGIMVVADFNANFKFKWFNVLLKSIAPGFKHTWKSIPGGGAGTLFDRVIDGTLLRGRIKVAGSAKLFKDDDSSDHRPFSETLRMFPKKKKKKRK